MDEIGYRSVLIGFPVFTLGALIFAMIWAHEAWSRFWGWDPKEVWALITWLFYAAFLHLRLSQGWEGEKVSMACGYRFHHYHVQLDCCKLNYCGFAFIRVNFDCTVTKDRVVFLCPESVISRHIAVTTR